jgi:hypothetical protein
VQYWDLKQIEAPEGTRSPAVLETVDGARAIVIRLAPGQELGDHQAAAATSTETTRPRFENDPPPPLTLPISPRPSDRDRVKLTRIEFRAPTRRSPVGALTRSSCKSADSARR